MAPAFAREHRAHETERAVVRFRLYSLKCNWSRTFAKALVDRENANDVVTHSIAYKLRSTKITSDAKL